MKKSVALVIIIVSLLGICLITNININLKLKSENVENIIEEYNKEEKTLKYKTYSYITDEMKENTNSYWRVVCYNEDPTEYAKKISDAIAIVSIVSIDGCENYGNIKGTMVVNNCIKGDLKPKSLMEYVKSGGIVTMSEYDAHDNPEAVEKRDYLREKEGITVDKDHTYVNLGTAEDIDVEAGKTYLAYLKYNNELSKYEILDYNTVLMEVNVPQTDEVEAKEYNLDELEILNNTTKEWESLKEYISNNI